MTKFEDLIKKTKEVSLTNQEKNEILVRIKFFVKSPSLLPISLILKTMLPAILIFALLTGGVSFASNNSLPGDLLYPVKIVLNEKVVGALQLTDSAKANWEAGLAAKRLEEAEKLAAKGRLNSETRAKVEANFKAHAEKIEERIAKLESKNNFKAAADVSVKFEKSLRAHEEVLVKLSEEKKGKKDSGEDGEGGGDGVEVELSSVLDKVKSQADKTSRARASSAEGKLKAAENKIAEVKRFIESKKGSSDMQTVIEAEAKLKVAESLIIEGLVKLETDAGAAFELFKKAHATAQGAKMMLEADEKKDSDADAKENVSKGFNSGGN